MSNGRFNKVYDALGIREAWRFTDDLTAYTQWALDTTKSAGQVVPLIFNSTQQNFSLNLQAIPGNVGAYPFLRYLDITNQKNPAFRGASPQAGFTNFSQTFPNGTTTQQSNVTSVDKIKKLLFNSVPAGITITDIQIAPFGTSNFVDLFPASFTAGGTAFDLESYFGSPYWDGSNLNGFIVKVTATNTGSSAQVNMTAYGVSNSFQNNVWLIDYQDAHNQLHRIGTFDDNEINKTYYLDRLVTVPVSDPTTPNFGTLLFTLLQSNHPFYTLETYNIVMGISIAYMLPETS